MKPKQRRAKEKQILEMIKGQEQRIENCRKKIEALNEAYSIEPKDNHQYCGKILYPSEKAAHKARKLINRDLVKNGKKPMRRAYFCDRCEAWHLTTVESWIPFPEHEALENIN